MHQKLMGSTEDWFVTLVGADLFVWAWETCAIQIIYWQEEDATHKIWTCPRSLLLVEMCRIDQRFVGMCPENCSFWTVALKKCFAFRYQVQPYPQQGVRRNPEDYGGLQQMQLTLCCFLILELSFWVMLEQEHGVLQWSWHQLNCMISWTIPMLTWFKNWLKQFWGDPGRTLPFTTSEATNTWKKHLTNSYFLCNWEMTRPIGMPDWFGTRTLGYITVFGEQPCGTLQYNGSFSCWLFDLPPCRICKRFSDLSHGKLAVVLMKTDFALTDSGKGVFLTKQCLLMGSLTLDDDFLASSIPLCETCG